MGDQVIVVTGASAGVGWAVVRAWHGAHMVRTDRNLVTAAEHGALGRP
jgi:NADP-dependent 3-hydroxy acid dehydrogenase YdfG